jgi:hypothetical protein
MLHQNCRKRQNTFAAPFMKKLTVERESSAYNTDFRESIPLTISSGANLHIQYFTIELVMKLDTEELLGSIGGLEFYLPHLELEALEPVHQTSVYLQKKN